MVLAETVAAAAERLRLGPERRAAPQDRGPLDAAAPRQLLRPPSVRRTVAGLSFETILAAKNTRFLNKL